MTDQAGNFYGATEFGGNSMSGQNDGAGIIFKLTRSGAETVLYRFDEGIDGGYPQGGVIVDQAGNLFGTAYFGGISDNGTVFKIAPDGTFTTIYRFRGGNDGANPVGSLIEDSAGNLFGVTQYGGGPDDGTVFEIAPNGTETLLHTFQGGKDGSGPSAGLTVEKNGDMYGTTGSGGRQGGGTVFRIKPDGSETVLYGFKDGVDGADPEGGLLADGRGNLYGTTFRGGTGQFGDVFKVTPNGKETILYTFLNGNDGSYPFAGLTAGPDGSLYGATGGGGINGCGVVFQLAPDGTETILHAFTGNYNGCEAQSTLVKGYKFLFGTLIASTKAPYGSVFAVRK